MDAFAIPIKERLDREAALRPHLFRRGYLVTEGATADPDEYPFYGGWNQIRVREYAILAHPETTVYACEQEDRAAVLIGHAYDPESGEIREQTILKKLLDAARAGRPQLFEALNDLTGVFVLILVSDDGLLAVQDPGGQKMLYYGRIGGRLVLTSIPQLAADVFRLSRDPAVERLCASKGYWRGSGFLPGNLSPYRELTRLGANMFLSADGSGLRAARFYPDRERRELNGEEEKRAAIERMYGILSGNIALAIKKWPRVGLSLTGGTDSQTAFACAKPYYGSFFCYSFESKATEKLDADAAEKICAAAGVEHHRYLIPEDPEEIEDYAFLRQIIEHNTSHLCKLHPNEIRKYIWLQRQHDFDVEIKSDMSEVGRAYLSRKYEKVRMPRVLSPRHMTILQGRYFMEPLAVKYADRAYGEFMEQTGLKDDISGYSMHDLTYWEVRMSGWAATSLASQEFFHEITIPYNNRRLLDLFLQFPEADRLRDEPHHRLMRRGNPVVADLGCSVKDSYLDKKRMLLETAYYYYATRGNTLGKK